VLTSDPISQDKAGNLYALWVDDKYVLKMSKSSDNAASWSKPVVVSAPGNGTTPLMSYHPIMVHHPSEPGRAGFAYYGSADKGATWNAYIAESGNIDAPSPVFSSMIVNEESQPMQQNANPTWDQGYLNPFADLIEFTGLRYNPKTGDLVGAFARKMCRQPVVDAAKFDTKSCAQGWDFHKKDNAPWQGYVAMVHH